MADMTGPVFPHGLQQAGDARCSVDALLLASFATGREVHAVDLGTGCGVVGLGLLLRKVAKTVEAVDIDEEQVGMAAENARRFGFADSFSARPGDVQWMTGPDVLADLVVCNPPWRRSGAERVPGSERKRVALYGTNATFPLFARAAASRLGRGGFFSVIIGAQRLPDMLTAMSGSGFSPLRLRAVHARKTHEAVFALLEARKSVQCAFTIEAPLVLHRDGSQGYTDEALQFCPWLG